LVCAMTLISEDSSIRPDGGASSNVVTPTFFACPVCRLNLFGEELESFPFPKTIDLGPDWRPPTDWITLTVDEDEAGSS
jgi:hypothetical protein